MTFVSRSYQNRFSRRIWNKYQDDIRLWTVPELLLGDDLNKYQDDIRIQIVPEPFLDDDKYQDDIRLWIVPELFLDENLE